MKTALLVLLVLINQAAAPAGPALQEAAGPVAKVAMVEYRVGIQDVLSFNVNDLESVSRDSVTVESDGTVELPLIGRFPVKGLALRAIEEEVKRRLVDGGYHLRPSVSVTVKDYRSQMINVIGEVRQPGPYELKGSVTIMQALGQAGHFTADAGTFIEIMSGGVEGPDGVLTAPQVSRVERIDIEHGRANHIRLKHGDTIRVPKTATFFVTGNVRSPGEYSMRPNLTVIQAITLGGGYTEKASTKGIKIERIVNGKAVKVKVKESDLVQPGDTISVPQRFF